MSEETGVPEEAPLRRTDWRMVLLGVLALVGTVVLVALVSLQARTDTERDAALGNQAHTYEVIIRAGLLSTAIAQSESALGRYVVSADRNIGLQYADAWNGARGHLNQLAQLTSDDPDQRERIGALRRAFDARGAELSNSAGYIVAKRNHEALGSYYLVIATAARASLQQSLDGLVAHERDLLASRKADADALSSSSRTAARVLAVFGMLIVIGAIALGVMMVKAIGERATADADAETERDRAAELQLAVADATEALREEMKERETAEAQLRQVQKMEAVGQLTGGIAHDFNNMLAVVLGGLELAKRHLHTGGPTANKHIESAMEGANRAAALTRRLLAFSREEALLPAAVEAGAVIHGMSDLLDRTLGGAIAVETRDDGRHWTVWIDRHQLENALLNLAVNARDAMEGKGLLTIATGGAVLAEHQVGECAAGEYVSIAVADTGSGMTPEVLERVFEPFFTTKPVGKGTGLGLSQIFGFVRQSGGEIAIRTAPGAGTTVTLYLPRHTGEADAEADAEAPFDIDAPHRTLDILLVEDDPRVLAATKSALAELGHRVVTSDDPLAVPGIIDTLPALDLIVSDVLMPGQTGPEMIAHLGRRLEGVAVLFVTGYAGDADAEAFHGRQVLRKPFTMAALARAVEGATAA